MTKLVFGLVNPKHTEAIDKLRQLTIAWTRYGYRGEIIEGNSIDNVLHKATDAGYQFCLLQHVGHVIDEQWYLPHWQQTGFHQGIQQLMTTDDFLAIGEWSVSNDGYAGFNCDCLLVNLTHYQMLDRPTFGSADQQTRTLPTYQINNHGNSLENPPTPINIKYTCHTAGWNFIQTSLAQGLTIKRFNPAINDNRFNLHHPDYISDFTKLLGKTIDQFNTIKTLTSTQKTFIQRIKKQFTDAQKGVFLLNIEPYDELIASPSDSTKLDAVFSVAAGFKPYRILYAKGFHADTKVVFFDYSKKALEVRQYIVENWDGDDFPSFIKEVFDKYPHPEVFYQLWHGATPATIDWHDMACLWQMELDKWGGADQFKACWQEYRKLPHQYLHYDLLKDRTELLTQLAYYQNSYIWWSNAFFTIFSHWHYSADERKSLYLNWVAELAQAAPNCQVNGADHNNMAVNGYSAVQYAQLFNQQQSDELNPQRLHSIDIQF